MDLLKLKEKLQKQFSKIQKKQLSQPTCFIGFDGFTDDIIKVVNKKLAHSKNYISTIKLFGKKIQEASNKSCNFELIVQQTKIGGNAPILTNALLEGGHSIVFAGAIGIKNKIEPLFLPMSSRCKKVFALGASGKTEALEFDDGKIILGKMESLNAITYENMIEQIGLSSLINLLDESDLLVCTNWTMLPSMTDIWEHLFKNIAPKFSNKTKKRYLFVDLADPSKRSKTDLKKALHILAKLENYYEVILGLNLKEAEIVANLFKIQFLKTSAASLFNKLKISRLLIHDQKFAIAVDKEDTLYLKSFYTKKPVLTTGAGDNFNAGYCNGLLYHLDKKETLLTALATAGFYVRNGKSPTMEELCCFLQLLYFK